MSLRNFHNGAEIRKYREKLGKNQSAFWARVNVQQSASSRYESGRTIPMPVQTMLKLVYGEDKVAAAVLTKLRAE